VDLAATCREISAAPAAFVVALLILLSSSSVSEGMVETFNSQGLHDISIQLIKELRSDISSYGMYLVERNNIYRIIVAKHEGKGLRLVWMTRYK
jgi:hypothetical protein